MAGRGMGVEFLAELLAAGHLIESGAPGLYGRGAYFEAVLAGVNRLIDGAVAAERPERLTFPPLLPRRQLEVAGYLDSFPHLAGSVFCFDGDDEDAAELAELASRRQDWSSHQRMTDVVLTPAACYPVYPAVAARGAIAAAGVVVDTGSAYVFRHEPSQSPLRMRLFHQRELVRIARPSTVTAWFEHWRSRAADLVRPLGLEARLKPASDPFFGRRGRLLASGQRAQRLKFELLVDVVGPEPTAIASFNHHRDHFAHAFGIKSVDGGEAVHTACLGFGGERIVLALLRRHGLDVRDWPAAVCGKLGL